MSGGIDLLGNEIIWNRVTFLTYGSFALKIKLLQKVLNLCVVSRMLLTNDVTEFETKLLGARYHQWHFIQSWKTLVFLHMYRKNLKNSGVLSYGSVIMGILREKGIEIPEELKWDNGLPRLEGFEILNRMCRSGQLLIDG